MNFELTEEQILIRETAREFTNNHLLPGVIERKSAISERSN